VKLKSSLEKSGYLCMFCNKAIEPGALDPCAIHLVARTDRSRKVQKEQTFFCHIACLQTAASIDPSNFYIVEPDFPTVGELAAP
jgi:hypothetical protein